MEVGLRFVSPSAFYLNGLIILIYRCIESLTCPSWFYLSTDSLHFACVSRISLLRSISLFQGISAEDLASLAQTLAIRKYKAGEFIFQQGDIGHTMYIVLNGQVNIYLQVFPHDLPLNTIKPGEYFGELALFDNEPRSASAFATTDVVLLELTQTVLTAFILKRPHVSLTLLGNLSARLRATNTLLSQRVSRNVDEDIEKRLTWGDRLADRVAELNGSWAFIIALIGLTITWVIVNTGTILHPPFDPYPFVFFNLVLAILVALQGPLIIMSQNRQARKDRERSIIDYKVNLKNEVNIEILLREIHQLKGELRGRLKKIEVDLDNSYESSTWELDEKPNK